MGEIKARRNDPRGKRAPEAFPSNQWEQKGSNRAALQLNEEVIDFMEKHKIYYSRAFLPSTSPDPGKALAEQLAIGIVKNLFGAGK